MKGLLDMLWLMGVYRRVTPSSPPPTARLEAVDPGGRAFKHDASVRLRLAPGKPAERGSQEEGLSSIMPPSSPTGPQESPIRTIHPRPVVQGNSPAQGHKGDRELVVNWGHVLELDQTPGAIRIRYIGDKDTVIETTEPARFLQVLKECWTMWRAGHIGGVLIRSKP